jgi:hypothetical protein
MLVDRAGTLMAGNLGPQGLEKLNQPLGITIN